MKRQASQTPTSCRRCMAYQTILHRLVRLFQHTGRLTTHRGAFEDACPKSFAGMLVARQVVVSQTILNREPMRTVTSVSLCHPNPKKVFPVPSLVAERPAWTL
jgi:hypothetical protein